MAAAISVRPPDRLAVIRMTGSVTGEEIAATARALSADPAFEPDFRVLWDGSEIVELDVPVEAFETLLAQEREFRERGESGELVFVVADDVWASLITLFVRKIKDDGRTLTVVRTRAEAAAHLGLGDA